MNQQIPELTYLTTLLQNVIAFIPVSKSSQDKDVEVNFQAFVIEYLLQDIQLLCLHEMI